MSTESTQIVQFLEIDEAVLKINQYLDSFDLDLMKRARTEEGLHGYRNSLLQYQLLLDKLLQNTSSPQQVLHESYFLGIKKIEDLYLILKNISPDNYENVMGRVATTLALRLDYFNQVDRALPCGRFLQSADIAWMHRKYPDVVKNYIAEHPQAAEYLTMEDNPRIKNICEFRAFKMQFVEQFEQAITVPRSPQFFPSALESEVSNFFNNQWLEPVKAIADNSGIMTYQSFLKSIEQLDITLTESWELVTDHLNANPKDDSPKHDKTLKTFETLSADAKNVIDNNFLKKLLKLFADTKDTLKQLIRDEEAPKSSVTVTL